jgi:hypothetical protein
MIRRMTNASHVGMVIDNSEEEGDIMFCSTCMAAGQMNKLKQRVYLDMSGKLLANPPPDAEDWLQCWECGNIIPKKDAKIQGKISGITGIEILSNPFDEKKGLILGNDARLTNRYRNLKRRQTKHPDAEVQKLIDQGYSVVSYQQDIPVSNSNNDNIY